LFLFQKGEERTGRKEVRRGQGDQNPSISEEGGVGREEAIKWKLELEVEREKVASLRGELSRQESLLLAYQEDNQKLYGALKGKEVSKQADRISSII